PPSSRIATSKETRVLVDGLKKIRATVCPSKLRRRLLLRRSLLSSAARSRTAVISCGRQSANDSTSRPRKALSTVSSRYDATQHTPFPHCFLLSNKLLRDLLSKA